MYYFLDIQTPYNMTTFCVSDYGFPLKNVFPSEVGKGDLLGVKCRA
jgi:hypothetical protein